MKTLALLFSLLCIGIKLCAQQSAEPLLFSIEPTLSFGKVVKNSPIAPASKVAVLSEINLGIQTDGRREWQHLYNFPKTSFLIAFGGLGNRKDLGSFIGIAPNMTLNALSQKWYSPKVAIGLGVAYFTNPYHAETNTTNYYIGSSITALGYASFYLQPEISKHITLKTGVSVIHCSNGHVQIPNLGINLPTLFFGFAYRPNAFPAKFERKDIAVPSAKLHFNVRMGMGVHELARTTEPVGTAKYAVYVTDFYVSKRFGKISNVQAGVEMNLYNSYYRYIVNNDFFASSRKLKASVVTLFLAHEFMIGHVSLLSQGGINVYNPFYSEYIKMYKSEQGTKTTLKKYISTRLGLQYYFWDPKYCARSNIFVGAYIKANFGQADFICAQVGFVL
jgi:hypothetical protein